MPGAQCPELGISMPVLHANHFADLSYQLILIGTTRDETRSASLEFSESFKTGSVVLTFGVLDPANPMPAVLY